MRSRGKLLRRWRLYAAALALAGAVVGCAPVLVGAGAAGGYAASKDMRDGKLIDSAPK